MREAEVEAEKAPDIVSQMSGRQRSRVEVIEALIAALDREAYWQRQQWAAERLHLSMSSIQRLMWAWKSSGKEGLSFRLFRLMWAFGDLGAIAQLYNVTA